MNTVKSIKNKPSNKIDVTFMTTKVILGTICFVALSIFPDNEYCQDQSGTVTIVSENESGKKLIIKGYILLPDGNSVAGARIWVFQTDAEGYYKKSKEGKDLGWREAKISHVFTAGPDGEFRIHSIRPAGYPDRPAPEHIHFRISTPEVKEQEHTIFFSDDDKVTNSFKSRIQRSDRLYLVDLETHDQVLTGEFDLVFDY